MKHEEVKKMINNVIDNEFNHISQYREFNDFNSDVEISSAREKMDKLLKKITELAPENFELTNSLESEFANYRTAASRYYFKEGVIAGTTNLKFLEETHIMQGI